MLFQHRHYNVCKAYTEAIWKDLHCQVWQTHSKTLWHNKQKTYPCELSYQKKMNPLKDRWPISCFLHNSIWLTKSIFQYGYQSRYNQCRPQSKTEPMKLPDNPLINILSTETVQRNRHIFSKGHNSQEIIWIARVHVFRKCCVKHSLFCVQIWF